MKKQGINKIPVSDWIIKLWWLLLLLFTQVCSALCNPWTAACQAFLSFTISQSLLTLMSIESVMPSNHLILLSSPSPPAFNFSQQQGVF